MGAVIQFPTPVLDSEAVYLGDNGRAFCGAHAGQSARFTDRDTSGQPVYRVTPAEAHALQVWHGVEIACEQCGKRP